MLLPDDRRLLETLERHTRTDIANLKVLEDFLHDVIAEDMPVIELSHARDGLIQNLRLISDRLEMP